MWLQSVLAQPAKPQSVRLLSSPPHCKFSIQMGSESRSRLASRLERLVDSSSSSSGSGRGSLTLSGDPGAVPGAGAKISLSRRSFS